MPRRATAYDLILFQGRRPHPFIWRDTVIEIQRKLDEVVTTKRDATEIDVWVDSPGGDAHAAYKLSLELRSRARKLRAIIPDCAKSAATLLVLGFDEIYMSAASELGPLDVQIAHPDRENQTISGLDVAGSLDYLSEVAVELAILGGGAIVEYTGLTRSEVLNATLRFTAEFLKPCVAKIDPHLTRRAVFQLKVTERYAKALLAQRSVPESQRLTPEAVNTLVERLVKQYPVHEFVISRDEARVIGLPVEDLEQYQQASLVRQVHAKFLQSRGTIIEVRKRIATRTPRKITKGTKKGARDEKRKQTEGE